MQNLKNYWAYLERFRAENQSLKMQFDKNRVVFIGDSIIEGWNQHPFLKENAHFINRGIGGQTTSQILARFTANVIQLQPKCVVISVGTNDIAENQGPITLEKIQHNFLTMIAVAKEHDLKIILCSILPVSAYYWNPKVLPGNKIRTLNAFLASLADDEMIFYIDFHTALEDKEKFNVKFTEDGVHPNLDGYTLMSDILLKSNYL
ncbi:GDSL-type esterase/lipase family protein [Flavobacterium tegetincola]|uniref:GDSL-type esterase/lipase family protein n=1 Tax=Flavobacterium tegetincola TaxID=150172 RepID=UPI000406E10D|nr:GDSL-type esterase/lipase family protein [Flavobacterium tegetincola]